MPHDDFQIEPVPGLPERPPEGERILWQGRPNRLHDRLLYTLDAGRWTLSRLAP